MLPEATKNHFTFPVGVNRDNSASNYISDKFLVTEKKSFPSSIYLSKIKSDPITPRPLAGKIKNVSKPKNIAQEENIIITKIKPENLHQISNFYNPLKEITIPLPLPPPPSFPTENKIVTPLITTKAITVSHHVTKQPGKRHPPKINKGELHAFGPKFQDKPRHPLPVGYGHLSFGKKKPSQNSPHIHKEINSGNYGDPKIEVISFHAPTEYCSGDFQPYSPASAFRQRRPLKKHNYDRPNKLIDILG